MEGYPSPAGYTPGLEVRAGGQSLNPHALSPETASLHLHPSPLPSGPRSLQVTGWKGQDFPGGVCYSGGLNYLFSFVLRHKEEQRLEIINFNALWEFFCVCNFLLFCPIIKLVSVASLY